MQSDPVAWDTLNLSFVPRLIVHQAAARVNSGDGVEHRSGRIRKRTKQ
jgi:hypothetical protein